VRPVVDDEGQGPELPQRRKSTNMIPHFTKYTSDAPLFKPAYAQGSSIPSRIQSPPRVRHPTCVQGCVGRGRSQQLSPLAVCSLSHICMSMDVSFYSPAFLNFFGCAALPQQVHWSRIGKFGNSTTEMSSTDASH